MHCDSLTKVNSERGLVNRYNMSKKYAALQFFAAFIPAGSLPGEQRRRELMRLCDIYLCESERVGLRHINGIRSLMDAVEGNRSASLFTVEGGGGLTADCDELITLYNIGLRILGLVWDTNELGASCYEAEDSGLTEEGRRLAENAIALGITLDVSHLSDRGFYELAELHGAPMIATHSNFRDICPSRRNLTLDMAKIITERGGVIGLNLYPGFLKEGADASLDDIIRHIDYALEHLGDSSLGFGFDIDGTDGKYPRGFTEGSSLHDRLIDELISRYPLRTVERLSGGNIIDFLKGAI